MAELGPPRDDLIEHTTPAKDCICGPAHFNIRAADPDDAYLHADGTRHVDGPLLGDVWIHRRLDEDGAA